MKKYTLLLIAILFTLTTFAQKDTTYWKRTGDFSLNFNQISFNNWAAGGDNSISGVALFNYQADFDDGVHSWKNKAILGYGLQYLKDDYKKTEDKIDLSSMYGRKIAPKWDVSMLVFFKTQFAEGFDGDNDSVSVSQFMAPAYVGIGPGFNYKPVDYFSVFMSPATAQWVIVNNQRLADEGAFGVTKAEYDTEGMKTKDGEKVKFQFGANVKISFKKDIAKNVNLETTLELFSDYLNNPQNIIINWDLILDMKINSFLSAKITTNLIYDDNIIINDKHGNPLGPRTQFKEMFGLGLAVKF
ncbi:MAG: hypothetical protein B7C24_03685 [Bacteroidetes bacterium 4572_77]|nr:MAG: hypothetical protein B7C24_03685 [Bacteroidetes bacterium 4572_77]